MDETAGRNALESVEQKGVKENVLFSKLKTWWLRFGVMSGEQGTHQSM